MSATAQPFTAADFSLAVQPEQSSYQPGQLIIFDGFLTNLSSQTATFGTNMNDSRANIYLQYAGYGPEINGQYIYTSPYISSVNYVVELDQTEASVAPGGTLQFQFLTVATLPSIPVGSTITTGAGNLSFQTIPRSTSDPNVDFFDFLPSGSVTIAVPEPTTPLLASLSLVVNWFYRRKRRQSSIGHIRICD